MSNFWTKYLNKLANLIMMKRMNITIQKKMQNQMVPRVI